jgi:hypothetical protein
MNYIMVLVWAIIFANALMGEEQAGNLATKFMLLPIEQRVMANLPKGREEDVINALIQGGNFAPLLRINHGPTVEKIIGKYLEKEGKWVSARRAIEDSGSPYLVEKLAPALYKGDKMIPRLWGEGETDLGQSAAAALLVGKLLMKSPEFPAEVKEWANRNLKGNSDVCIAVARQFWELNQEALKAQKFEQVVAPKGAPSFAPLPRSAASPDPVTPQVRPTKRSLPPSVVSTPAQDVGSASYWWVIGLLIALIVCIVIIRKKT